MVPPKSSILIGFSIINNPFWGTPIFGNTHIVHLINWFSPDSVHPYRSDFRPSKETPEGFRPRGCRCEGTAASSATSHPLRAGKIVVEKLESLSHHEFGLGPPLMFIVKLYNFFLAFCSFKLQHGWEGTCARKPQQSACWSKQPMNKFNRSMLKNRVGIFEMTVADNWRKPKDISCICTAPIWKPRALQLCFYRSLQFFTHCRSMCNIQMILWTFLSLCDRSHTGFKHGHCA